jgi:predicted acetyltransferase
LSDGLNPGRSTTVAHVPPLKRYPDSGVRLRPLRLSDEPAALAAHQELADADGFDFLLGHHPADRWADYLQRLEDQRRGKSLTEGWVPGTFRVAVVGGRIVGRISIRHELNDYLSAIGGHVGYAVLPSVRRKGLGTEILRQGLVIARSEGVDRVLATCDEDNEGSFRAIERCGGVLESVVPGEAGGTRKRRYWID